MPCRRRSCVRSVAVLVDVICDRTGRFARWLSGGGGVRPRSIRKKFPFSTALGAGGRDSVLKQPEGDKSCARAPRLHAHTIIGNITRVRQHMEAFLSRVMIA